MSSPLVPVIQNASLPGSGDVTLGDDDGGDADPAAPGFDACRLLAQTFYCESLEPSCAEGLNTRAFGIYTQTRWLEYSSEKDG